MSTRKRVDIAAGTGSGSSGKKKFLLVGVAAVFVVIGAIVLSSCATQIGPGQTAV
ncbi:hypothetical protein [Mycolicibacterium sp. A43C]